MMDNRYNLRSKIDMEGWPDAAEWFWEGNFDNPRIGEILNEALDLRLELEDLLDELEPLLSDDTQD